MKNSKFFVQYSGEGFSIRTGIDIDGKVKLKSGLVLSGEDLFEYHKQYYRDNAKHFCEYRKQRYQDNHEKFLQYKKQWRFDNPQKVREHRHNQKAKRRGWGVPLPMNSYFKDSHLHHLHINGDHRTCIYVPVDLHTSMRHAWNSPDTMLEINIEIFKWYYGITINGVIQ